MTPWQARVTPLIQRMAEDMLLRNLAQKTIDSYTYHIGRFAIFIGKPVEDAVPEDLRSFQLHLVQERKVSWSSFNQAVCGCVKGVRHQLCAAPVGPFRQLVPDPFNTTCDNDSLRQAPEETAGCFGSR